MLPVILDPGRSRGLYGCSYAEARDRYRNDSELSIYSRSDGIVGISVAETLEVCCPTVTECNAEIRRVQCVFLEVLVHLIVEGYDAEIGPEEYLVGNVEADVEHHVVLASARLASVSLVDDIAEPDVVELVSAAVGRFVD